MIRQLPIIPTIFVAAAAAVMVWLGFWQLGRADEKAELIRLSEAAMASDEAVAFPTGADDRDKWFRRSKVDCEREGEIAAIAGTAATGAKGWAFRASCAGGYWVDIGFSRALADPKWEGGTVTGVIAEGPRLVSDTGIAGLDPLARPEPRDLPNNHLAYAGQWFFFALTALVIYGFAVRAKIKKQG
jgi:surfeit locus 1 family protein